LLPILLFLLVVAFLLVAVALAFVAVLLEEVVAFPFLDDLAAIPL
jgi:hypothetical protein